MIGNKKERFMELYTEAQSPCINKCSLDQQQICTGCFRSIDEITSWQDASADRKQQVLIQCGVRKLDHQQQYPVPPNK